MMMIPAWSRKDGLVHLAYDLPNRIYDAHIYPVRAPNGSTVTIYGHERGITVIWRGGRPFRKPSGNTVKNAPKPTSRGVDEDSIMIIDDDEEEEKTAHPTGEMSLQGFEDEEEEYDISQPFEEIIHSYDVRKINTGVLHLAIPPIGCYPSSKTLSTPSILHKDIILVAACADSTIRLLTLPLLPNSNHNAYSVQQHTITQSKTNLSNVSRDVTATWTATSADSSDWTLLVATHSAEAGGLLAMYQCPLSRSSTRFDGTAIVRLRQEYLNTLATSISFSSAAFPQRGHSQLLLTDSRGMVRIYDPLRDPDSRSHRSAHDQDPQQRGQRGTWLASLSSSNLATAGSKTGSDRARILDAKWALGGTCILALLTDGQWGLWDLEGIATQLGSGKDSKLSDRTTSIGSMSHFALQGFIGDSVDARSAGYAVDATKNSGFAPSTPTKDTTLAPMTPNTRRTKQERLFSGPTKTVTTSGIVKGGISVSSMLVPSLDDLPDDSVVMWHGTSVYFMPSLLSYWRRVASKATSQQDTSTLFGPSITPLNVSTAGELITSISQFTHEQPTEKSSGTSFTKSSRPSLKDDVLIAAEHRLILLCPLKKPNQPLSEVTTTSSQDLDLRSEDLTRLDQDLLARGQLGLGGLDRMLDGLAAGSGAAPPTTQDNRNSLFGTSKKKVGFASNF